MFQKQSLKFSLYAATPQYHGFMLNVAVKTGLEARRGSTRLCASKLV